MALLVAEQLIAQFQSRRWTVATCESLTGGLVGAALTAVPGSSAVFRGGLITYASDLKAALAGVDPQLIAAQGVVNGEVALQMARGAKQQCATDWAISTTGVAGPATADGQPVGTVWFGVIGPANSHGEATAQVVQQHFTGDRETIRNAAVEYACAFLQRIALTIWE